MTKIIVPDYIIFDELKRKREKRVEDNRPMLEMPHYRPYWPEPEDEDEEDGYDSESREDSERGEVIIPMW